MRKVLSCFLIFCLFLCTVSCAEETLYTDEDVLSVLRSVTADRPEQIDMICSEELFSELSDNNFSRLTMLGWDAGIKNMYVRYNESAGLIRLSSFEYGSVRYIEARSINDCARAFAECAAQNGTELTIVCKSDVLFDTLWNGEVYSCAGMSGVERMSVMGRGCNIEVSDIRYFDVPQRTVTSEQGFLDAISEFASLSAEEFYLCFDEFSYRSIMEDNENYRVLVALSDLDRYGCSYNSSYRYARFYAVTYNADPKVLCTAPQEIVSAINTMGAAGAKGFTLVLDQVLYGQISADNFETLHRLEASAGMTDSSMWYSSDSCTITYKDAEIVADMKVLTTYQEAQEQVLRQTTGGTGAVNLFCSEELYTELLSQPHENLRLIDDLMTSAGLYDCSYSYSDTTCIITLNANEFYPGTHIIKCIENGTSSELSPREQAACKAAMQMARECTRDTELNTARAIHDALCERIVYTIDFSTDEDDTAIGALLNGQANCDGYADAFYLVGSLAGLNVRCQHGDTYEGGSLFGGDETHMWNLLYLDGSWRMVDVTWDDDEEGSPRSTWFNIGYDRASRTHIWNENVSTALCMETDLAMRPKDEFSVRDVTEASSMLPEAIKISPDRLVIFFECEISEEDCKSLVSEFMKLSQMAHCTYSIDERMHTLTLNGNQ